VDPENFKAYSNLGVSLAKAGRHDEAQAQFRKALELNPDDARTLSTVGGMLVEQGQLEQARTYLQQALEIDPADADANNNLGGILARAGDFDAAIPLFEKAAIVDPESLTVHYNLGRALAAKGRHQEGIPHLRKAFELSGGKEPVILDRLSAMYAALRQWPEAIETAQRGADLAARTGNTPLARELTERAASYRQQSNGSAQR
jgi:protein O-GlcNAc transferase